MSTIKTFTAIAAIAGFKREGGFYFSAALLERIVSDFNKLDDAWKYAQSFPPNTGDHPVFELDPSRIAAHVDEVTLDSNGVLRVKFTMLDTPMGKILMGIYDDINKRFMAEFDISLAGCGTVSDDGRVNDDYRFCNFHIKVKQVR